MPRSPRKSPVKPPRRECELSPPIQKYLEAQGYTVRCEVNGCDITAVRGDELVVVELKRQFSTDLLIQAIERQRVAEAVYVALPNDGEFSRLRASYSKRWRGIESLLKRLELGLFVVCFPEDSDAPATIELVRHPIAEARARSKPAVRRTIVREISGRSAGDYNVGGTTGRGISTAYREQAIFIACCLDRYGPLSPARIIKLCGTSPKTSNILHRNVYGWFDRQSRGMYALRPVGREIIAAEYSGIAAFYADKIDASFRLGAVGEPAEGIIGEG